MKTKEKYKKVFLMLFTILFLLGCEWVKENTFSGQQVKEVDTTILVDGVELQITSVEKNDTYTLNGEQHQPTFPEDTFLIVQSNLAPSGVEKASDWKVYVTDSNGKRDDATISSWWTKDKDNALGGRAEWVFVVSETGTGFILTLPQDNNIQLEPLLK